MTTSVTYKITQAAKPNPWQWDNCIAIFRHNGSDFSPVKSGTDMGLELFMCKGIGSSTIRSSGEYTEVFNAFGINKVSQFTANYPTEVINPNEVIIRLPKSVTEVKYNIDNEAFTNTATKYEYDNSVQYVPLLKGKDTYDDNWSYWSINISNWSSSYQTAGEVFNKMTLNFKYK